MTRQTLGLVLVLLGSASCKSLVEERCEEICACRQCSDFGEEDCLIATEGSIDIAAAYSCEAEAEAYLDCELESYVCVDDDYSLPDGSCAPQRDELGSCMGDASGRGPGPYQAF